MLEPPELDRGRILICDDSIEEIRVLVAMLRRVHYRLMISGSGSDAINRANALKPDLILMDVRMPNMDGFAACRLLKAHPETRDIPLIFLTAANELEDRLEGLRLGAVDYIVKPAEEQEVLLRVGIHLKRNPAQSTPTSAPDQPHLDPMWTVVKAACRVLERNLSITPSLDELSAMVGTHRHKLSAAFKQTFGTTVSAWLREKRMQQAAILLAQTNLSIEVVGEEMGFSTGGNFATAFRERFGTTPREYRRMVAEQGRKFEQATD